MIWSDLVPRESYARIPQAVLSCDYIYIYTYLYNSIGELLIWSIMFVLIMCSRNPFREPLLGTLSGNPFWDLAKHLLNIQELFSGNPFPGPFGMVSNESATRPEQDMIKCL